MNGDSAGLWKRHAVCRPPLSSLAWRQVWLDTSSFNKVVPGSMVRCSQIFNGTRTFYAAFVIGIKRATRPYKVGKKVAEVVLQARLPLPPSLAPPHLCRLSAASVD